jgi:predicted Rossmann fold nucleotide-binding protein DprA/Smf involved in DNA uptake
MSIVEINFIARDNDSYPQSLIQLCEEAPDRFYYIGNLSLLHNNILGFVCSQFCPPSLILKTTDIFKTLRTSDYTIASGFHSPVEQEVLRVLLRGISPVIIVLARSLQGMRLKKEYRELMDQDRLLLLSPFEPEMKRISKEKSQQRNRIVAALSNTFFIPYAHPGGQLEQMCLTLSKQQQVFYTLSSDYNQKLLSEGAQILEIK